MVVKTARTVIYFDVPPPPSRHCPGYGVMRIGTFSKVAPPACELAGYRPGTIKALTKVRYDMGASLLLRGAIPEIRPSRVPCGRVACTRSLRTLCDSLEETLRPVRPSRSTRPTGGFFLWLECIGAPASEVRAAAAEEGLILAGGSTFFHDPKRAQAVSQAPSAARLSTSSEVGPRLARSARSSLRLPTADLPALANKSLAQWATRSFF